MNKCVVTSLSLSPTNVNEKGNPDLVERLKTSDADLNVYDRTTFYERDQVRGYIDYPTMKGGGRKVETMKQKDIGITLSKL